MEKPDSQTAAEVECAPSPVPASEQVTAFIKRLGPAGPLALVAMGCPAIGGWVLLATVPWLGPWLRSHDALGFALYIVGYALLGGLSLLPTYAQSVLAGFAFRAAWGSVAAVTGFAGASAIGYAIARRASGDRVMRIIDEHPKWRAVYDALLGSGFGKTLGIITLLRLPPNSPFALTNLIMAATKVPPAAFVLGTIAGLTPRTLVAVFVGASWQEWNSDDASRMPRWMIIAGILTALIAIGIVGQIANKAIARVTAGQQPVSGPVN